MLIFCTAVVSLGVSRAPLKRGTAATHPILCRSHEKEYTLFTLLSAGLLKTVWGEVKEESVGEKKYAFKQNIQFNRKIKNYSKCTCV